MPWRHISDPYHILVSEIMLQQTQVERVVPKYERFIKAFPTPKTLADSETSELLGLWQGLGYNRRALYLRKAAQQIIERHGGKFPRTLEDIDALPGVGKATAGAIMAYAHQEPSAFIETNVRRVFLHFFFPNGRKVTDERLIPLVERAVDQKNPRDWYYALMDYGTMLKKSVSRNPNRRSAQYAKQSKFEGSNRQIRGRVLKILLKNKKMSEKRLVSELGDARAGKNVSQLVSEGFLRREGDSIAIA